MSGSTPEYSAPARWRRRLLWCSAALGAILLVGGLWLRHRWHACLPQLDGTRAVPGLSAGVSVERDALGIPTVRAASRLDAMRTLGWLHAQDRFFQMDLQRRRAAGELAELVGARALSADKEVRRHDLRAFSQKAVARLPREQKELVEAYTAGVNAGLAALGAPPWEYAVLRVAARPWKEEDSVLVGYSIALSLQDTGRYDRSLDTLRELHGESAVRFFAPVIGPDDMAADGSTEKLAPIPGTRSFQLRKAPAAAAPAVSQAGEADLPRAGSNAFALSGRYAQGGAAMLANDMHLGLMVPAIWYRVVLAWKDPSDTWIGGLSLPGTPGIIVGSNRHVAWGFTHCPADTADLIQVIPEPEAETLYRRQNDLARYDARKAVIKVKGGDDVVQTTQWTDWGPVIGKTRDKERPLVLAWTAHSPEAIDFTLTEMDGARTAAEAIDVARRSGLPALNCIAADSKGAVAWAVAGRLPRRVGYDGRTPSLRLFGDRRWDGFLPPSENPALLDPPEGWVASANERMWGGKILSVLGDSGYDNPHRIRQIRQGLDLLASGAARGAEKVRPTDLFAIQLDDRAAFLQRWRDLALRLVPAESTGPRADFRHFVEAWDGRASTASIGHLLLREFRRHATNRILSPIFAECAEADAQFSWRRFRYEPALWALIDSKPMHLLSPAYSGWDEPLLAAIDDTIRDATRDGRRLGELTWGERNAARVQHPLAKGLPGWLARHLDMPALPLSGDNQIPRVATPTFGASERMVVAPGREQEGICHIPGGQCGHPASPFYRAGFEAWARGEPLPFLPGPATHALTLIPAPPTASLR